MGLAILRLGAGIPLIYFSIESLVGAGPPQSCTVLCDALGGLAGLALIIGLWTPVAGGLVVVTQLLVLISKPSSTHADSLAHIVLAVLGAGLTLLGPGAWSLDARLFGRKRLTLER